MLLFVAGAWLGASAPLTQSIRITGTDYAFTIPESIRAGETLISFENRGTVRHEMSIVLLKAGVSPDSVLRAMAGGSGRRGFVDGQGALIISAPGEPSGPQLWIDLRQGRDYLVLCTLRDGPDQPPHTTLGMFGAFRPVQ